MRVTTAFDNRSTAYSGVVRTGEVTTGHDVDLLLDFLNTIDLEKHTDLLDDAHGWRSWLTARNLSGGDAARVRAVRDGLRAAAAGEPASLGGFAVPVEVAGGVPRLAGVEVTEAALGRRCGWRCSGSGSG